jgi:hypothetical protein
MTKIKKGKHEVIPEFATRAIAEMGKEVKRMPILPGMKPPESPEEDKKDSKRRNENDREKTGVKSRRSDPQEFIFPMTSYMFIIDSRLL